MTTYEQCIVDCIRLQTKFTMADRICTENYKVATESQKETIIALYEASVTEYVKKTKEKLIKAFNAIVKWITDRIKLIKTKFMKVSKKLDDHEEYFKQFADVQVDFYEEDRIKYIERELGLVEQQVIRYWKLLEEIIKAKDIDEVNELIAVNNMTLENGVGSIKSIMEDLREKSDTTTKVKFSVVMKYREEHNPVQLQTDLIEERARIDAIIATLKKYMDSDRDRKHHMVLPYVVNLSKALMEFANARQYIRLSMTEKSFKAFTDATK